MCRQRKLIPHIGQCLEECPQDYSRVDGQQVYCSLQCSGDFIVRTVKDLLPLQDCVSINGSLTITLSDFKNPIISDLERLLINIKEITGYLKVQHSPQLVSLGFLRHLDTIKGDQLVDNKYALIIVDNHHLEEIWSLHHKVAILKGHVYFHLNPSLCHDKILNLASSIKSTQKISITDASPNSNGERVICGNATRWLNAIVEDYNSTAARIKVEPMSAEDREVLIGYLYHYKEANVRNVTMYDGRHGCGRDNWRMDISPNQNVRHLITHLKPYTQYAYFVKTLTMTDYHTQIEAYSKIQYFRTLPSKPGPVAKIYYRSVSSTEIMIHWWPPRNKNGKISKYIVLVERVETPTQIESIKNYRPELLPKNAIETCECEKVFPELSGPTPNDENYFNKEQITYDEALQNLIYVPRLSESKQKNIEISTTEKSTQNQVSNTSNEISKDTEDYSSLSANGNSKSDNLTNNSKDINGNSSDAWETQAERFYRKIRLEMESKALAQQDTGIKAFPIIKPKEICPNLCSSACQLENSCKPAEIYKGIEIPSHLHAYTLNMLQPEITYRIAIRACVDDLQNGCGSETIIFAETMSKSIEAFLKQNLLQ